MEDDEFHVLFGYEQDGTYIYELDVSGTHHRGAHAARTSMVTGEVQTQNRGAFGTK